MPEKPPKRLKTLSFQHGLRSCSLSSEYALLAVLSCGHLSGAQSKGPLKNHHKPNQPMTMSSK